MSESADFDLPIDLTDVQEFDGDGGGPPALPVGEFVFDVIAASKGSSKSNQPKIEVTFETVEPEEHRGVQIKNNYSLQTQALGRIKKLLMACGGSLTQIRAADLVGARIRASVVHNEGPAQADANGNPRPVRIFANVCAERPLDDAAPAAQEAAAPPPVTRGRGAGTAAAPAKAATRGRA